MKLKFNVSMAGHSHAWNPGETHDVEPKEAARLIKAGYAVAVDDKAAAPVNAPPRAQAETAKAVRPKAETRKAPARKAAAKK